jgi:gas vesicle protein
MKRMLMGIAIGAGAMYLLDPEKGEERRRRLLGFYSENKDTFQDYAQTAAQTAVTIGETVGSTAGSVAEKAGEISGRGEKATSGSGSTPGAVTTNGSPSGKVDTRPASRKAEDAPGMGGSLSSS